MRQIGIFRRFLPTIKLIRPDKTEILFKVALKHNNPNPTGHNIVW